MQSVGHLPSLALRLALQDASPALPCSDLAALVLQFSVSSFGKETPTLLEELELDTLSFGKVPLGCVQRQCSHG